MTLILVRILLWSHTLNSRSSACIPSSSKIRRNFIDRFEPFVIFVQYKLSLSDLGSNSQPSVSNIVVSSKQLNPFTSQTESLNNIIDFWRFRQRSCFRLLSNDDIYIDIGMNERTVKCFFGISSVCHQTVFFDSDKEAFLIDLWNFLFIEIGFNPNDIFASFKSPFFYELSCILEMFCACPEK